MELRQDTLKDKLKRGGHELLRSVCIYKSFMDFHDVTYSASDHVRHAGEIVSNVLVKIILPSLLFGPVGTAGGIAILTSETAAAAYKYSTKVQPDGYVDANGI